MAGGLEVEGRFLFYEVFAFFGASRCSSSEELELRVIGTSMIHSILYSYIYYFISISIWELVFQRSEISIYLVISLSILRGHDDQSSSCTTFLPDDFVFPPAFFEELDAPPPPPPLEVVVMGWLD